MMKNICIKVIFLLLVFVFSSGFTQTLGDWTSLISLPSPRSECVAVLVDTTVYIVGGSEFSSGTSYPILRTGILPDGILSGWVEESCRPLEIRSDSIIFANAGYLYAISGRNGPDLDRSTTIERAVIKSDGSIGKWTYYGYCPSPGFWESTWLQTSTDLYVFGGYPGTQEIWRLPLYDNGSIGTFSRLSSDYNIARFGTGVVLVGDRLFIQGGANVYGPGQPEYTESAQLFSRDSIGEWKILTKTQNEHWTHMLAKIGKHLYSVAGVLPGEDRRGCESVDILEDGTLGAWDAGFPHPHQRIHFAHLQTDKGLYVFGGWGNHDLDGVEFVPIIPPSSVKSSQWKGYE
jgi:hypothetical protein